VTSKSAQGRTGVKAPKAAQATRSSAKPAKKAPAKAPPKGHVKTPAKAPSVPAAKKASAKPPSKPAHKNPARPASKALAKTSAKPAAKPSAKPTPKPLTKMTTAKAAAAAPKRTATTGPSTSRSGPTATARAPATAGAKSAAHPTPKPVPAKAAQSAHAGAAPVKAGTAPVAKPVVVAPAPRPVRTSRLMQLTVPGMAQSVASTAAKSSYSQLPAQVVAAPPVYVAAAKDPKLANNWKRKALEDLTEADVLAMPDSEYMNQVQMSYFKRVLVQLRTDMLSNAGETTEHLREDTVIVPDPADRATIEEEHALELRTRDRERKLLKKVEQSINRIDSGDYGYCDETGEPIGVGRLLARPTANLSLEAQQRRELKQKMFGD
jgi:DnaK suppressor protein